MNRIKIFVPTLPVLLGGYIQLRVGSFSNNILTDITELASYEVIQGSDLVKSVLNSKGLYLCQDTGGVAVKAYYSVLGYEFTDTITFTIINYASTPSVNNLVAQFKSLLPNSVYNLSNNNMGGSGFIYSDIQATSEMIGAQYQQLSILIDNFFPERASLGINWQKQLLPDFYSTQPSNDLNQFLRNLNYSSSLSAFDVAKSITSYIFFRGGYNLYVYINESKINFSFVWLLGEPTRSDLGATTKLSEENTRKNTFEIIIYDPNAVIDTELKKEIFIFIKRISPANCYPIVFYKNISVEEDKFILLGMSYPSDPRLAWSYCLCYDQNAFYNVLGAKNIRKPNLDEMIDFNVISPSEGAVISVDVEIIIIGIFLGGAEYNVAIEIEKNAIIKDENTYSYVWVMSNAIIINPYKITSPFTKEMSITYTGNNITKTITYQVTQ